MSAPLAVAVVSMILACGPTLGSSSESDGDAGSTMSDQESDGGDVSTGSPNTTGDVPDPSTSTSIGGSTDEGDDLDSSTDSGAGFIYGGPDGPPPDECDLFAQDCPEEEKCAPWANDGGMVFNATRCSPIDDQPDAVGEACEYQGSYVSGLDSCGQGAVCLPTTIDASEAACVALCIGDAANPYCEDPETTCVAPYGEAAPICLPTCDPLQPDGCDPGETCAPFEDDWTCRPTQGLAPGEPCEASNACTTGSICLPEAELDTCDSDFCCSPLCDLFEPDPDATCTGSEQCQAYYEPDHFGMENLGVCALP